MEKLQKYCLSVILVIIYSNVSANITTEIIGNIGCEKLYNKLLSEGVDDSILFSNFNAGNQYSVLNQRHKAIDVFDEKKYEVQPNYQVNFISDYFEFDQYDKALENFEKQSRQKDFAENTYFKSKVAKIRNKDDLDLKNRT